MRTAEIALLLNGELHGSEDIEITKLASLSDADWSALAFADAAGDDITSNAGCVLIRDNSSASRFTSAIVVKDPKLAFAKISVEIIQKNELKGIHPSAAINDSAFVNAEYIGAFVTVGERSVIGVGCSIHEGTRIGRDVEIGEGTTIFPNCVIYDGAKIGSGCLLHAGVVIGADGFGFVRGSDGYYKFPQIGGVVIEDNVELGANTCVDRGSLGETRIGKGTKIDNLVQIAHNVKIGRRVVIAAQTGISGSTVIEDDCVIGGQVGMGDHATVRSGAIIGSQAGVLPGKIVRPGVWWGTPIQPLDEYKRQNALIKGLARIKDDIKDLKKKLSGGDGDQA